MRKVIWLSNVCILIALALILFLPSCQHEADGADRTRIQSVERDRLPAAVGGEAEKTLEANTNSN